MDVYDHANGLMPISLGDIICLPMVLRAAMDLKVFEIIADAGPEAMLSPAEMVAKMPTSNPHAAASLERILRVLVTDAILTMSVRSDGKGGVPEHLYGLTDRSRFLVPDKDGVTAAAIAKLSLDRATVEGLFYLKDAVIEGGRTPFEMAHGVDIFGFSSKEPRFNNLFQEAMSNGSVIALKEIFKVYKGFNEVKQVMDVGGGTGTCISSIVSHFPHIRGSNFDLPHVIESAPHCPGVEHVGGNMFEGVPSAETIFMKFVLHDWDDDHCVKLLKNCWNALPDGGKVINVELVVPSVLSTDAVSRHTATEDLWMMATSPGGKERTAAEYDNLAKAAGFAETRDIPISMGIHVIEFYKRISPKN
ncbi:(S)-scoulerine 9-O-methyltransferase-like isoform X1 [Magnolia sinica]|uniref:(S)-scoulerine 9-O-methyltransferase-like isoform X1 n=1 Tax=Magnolia sinica TaxID=86752 RepID=UPI002659BFFB|nr:(S)-scoulerine 9-O-methyltransferase-like isoform X1 [Magnolia sinica]